MASWRLTTADDDVRRRFADFATTLAQPATLAAPPNRLRAVHRVDGAGGPWFIKVFSRTQWKNRIWFRCTQPRAGHDAEREYLVTAALRDAGYGAPDPIAWGHQGNRSIYVCRGLPGQPLAGLLAEGGVDADLARSAANFCGRLLAGGFALPDLSADHLFVTTAPAGPRFAVLDLHNGALRPPGPAPRGLLRRVLRRFARSVRQLGVAKRPALRFAVRLCRAAGAPQMVRSLLAEMPPWATAARYEVAGKSDAYATRNPRRDARELSLLARVWPGRAGEVVLDLPSGAARLLPFLHDRGHAAVLADGALAMLRTGRARHGDAPAVLADALQVPFADGAVDGVVCFRFLHHLAPELQRRALAEACRVARRFVVVSFFHPCSAHQLRRQVHQWFGRPRTRFPIGLAAISAIARTHGFRVHRTAADLPFARDLWLVAFVRD